MVMSDNTSVVDDNEVCVERVDDDCLWEFDFLVLGIACSGNFFKFVLARKNHHRIQETVPWMVPHHQPQPWARLQRYRFGRINEWVIVTGGGW